MGAKEEYFQGAEEFSFRDSGKSMHYFQRSREHRPPGGDGSLWHAQALNTNTLSRSHATTEISTIWKNRYSTELLDSSTETYTRMTNIMDGYRGGDRGSVPPLVNHKNIGFLSSTGPDPLKNHKATNPAFNVRHARETPLQWLSLAGRWWPANSGILILPPLIIKKREKKRYQIWTPSDKTICTIYSSFNTGAMTHPYYRIYTEQKKNVIYIVPKLLIPKRYIRAIICVFIAWQTSESHLHKGIFLFHHSGQKYLSSTDWKYIKQQKNATRMRNDINFHVFKF